jgi:hypothetical protein
LKIIWRRIKKKKTSFPYDFKPIKSMEVCRDPTASLGEQDEGEAVWQRPVDSSSHHVLRAWPGQGGKSAPS